MRLSTYRPGPPLSGYVDCFWLFEGSQAGPVNEGILPTGTFELAINLRENRLLMQEAEPPHGGTSFSGAIVSGAHGKGFKCVAEEKTHIIGVHFKPGGAFPFLGVSAGELADAHVDLEALWGNFAFRLRERLGEASNDAERFGLLEQGLLRKMFRPLEHHYAVSAVLEIVGRPGGLTVREMARQVGLSQRRLIEVFKAEVGVTPKLFSRVLRFQRARALLHRHTEKIDLTAVALDCAYFDQSHFIRDFLEFSGLSPAAYVRQYKCYLERQVNLESYDLPLYSKLGQFYPIRQISGDDIISLGGNYVRKL